MLVQTTGGTGGSLTSRIAGGDSFKRVASRGTASGLRERISRDTPSTAIRIHRSEVDITATGGESFASGSERVRIKGSKMIMAVSASRNSAFNRFQLGRAR